MKMKQPSDALQNASRTSTNRGCGTKDGSKPVRYIVPGLYLTPFGDRRGGCLKARC